MPPSLRLFDAGGPEEVGIGFRAASIPSDSEESFLAASCRDFFVTFPASVENGKGPRK